MQFYIIISYLKRSQFCHWQSNCVKSPCEKKFVGQKVIGDAKKFFTPLRKLFGACEKLAAFPDNLETHLQDLLLISFNAFHLISLLRRIRMTFSLRWTLITFKLIRLCNPIKLIISEILLVSKILNYSTSRKISCIWKELNYPKFEIELCFAFYIKPLIWHDGSAIGFGSSDPSSIAAGSLVRRIRKWKRGGTQPCFKAENSVYCAKFLAVVVAQENFDNQ